MRRSRLDAASALKDGDVQLVNIFSADPKIAEQDLVTLADPKGLFLASNVVPIARLVQRFAAARARPISAGDPSIPRPSIAVKPSARA